MDFRIFLNLFFVLSLISVYSQNDGSKFYGEEFSFDIENVGISLKPSLSRTKVKGGNYINLSYERLLDEYAGCK